MRFPRDISPKPTPGPVHHGARRGRGSGVRISYSLISRPPPASILPDMGRLRKSGEIDVVPWKSGITIRRLLCGPRHAPLNGSQVFDLRYLARSRRMSSPVTPGQARLFLRPDLAPSTTEKPLRADHNFESARRSMFSSPCQGGQNFELFSVRGSNSRSAP